MTLVEKTRKIELVVNEEVRPILRRDGGEIELIDVQGNKVVVRLIGTCKGCYASAMTLKELVEEKLRELVDPSLEVVEDQVLGGVHFGPH
jgi:NifU-like protein